MQNNLSRREHREAFCFLEMPRSISMSESLTMQEEYTHIQKADSPCLTTCHLCFVTWHMWLKRVRLSSGGTNILGNIPCRALGDRAGVVLDHSFDHSFFGQRLAFADPLRNGEKVSSPIALSPFPSSLFASPCKDQVDFSLQRFSCIHNLLKKQW